MARSHARSRGSLRRRAEHSYVTRRVLLPAQDFIHRAGTSSVLLLAAAAAALLWANSPWRESYQHVWETPLVLQFGGFELRKTLHHLINDGLMALFFFAVGLEIKRELAVGDLSSRKRAALPVAAALGGMVAPALIYVAFNAGHESARGWGIPMATDIAFALGALMLLGRRVPPELRVLLLALAIVDDIGSILVIAFFYTDSISYQALLTAGFLLGLILLMRRLGFRTWLSYFVVGVAFWLAVLLSGVHATIAGVVLGLVTPTSAWYSLETFLKSSDELQGRYRKAVQESNEDAMQGLLGQFEELTRGTESPLERLERQVHPWTTLFVIPLFALANSGVELSWSLLREALHSPVTHGIVLGLVLGKIAGIVGFSYLAVKAGLAVLPGRVTWPQITGMAMLAGIGFTVSLFITALAFSSERVIAEAKIAILFASVLAGAIGYGYLRTFCKEAPAERRRAASQD